MKKGKKEETRCKGFGSAGEKKIEGGLNRV